MTDRSESRIAVDIAVRSACVAAGLMGAAGVSLAAASAHLSNAEHLSTASAMLLFHATAILALAASSHRSRLIAAAQLCFVVGAVLFAGTLTIGVLAGVDFDPSPAPFGGTLLILGWLLAAVAFVRQPTVKDV